jgi:hypothetical protein
VFIIVLKLTLYIVFNNHVIISIKVGFHVLRYQHSFPDLHKHVNLLNVHLANTTTSTAAF